MKPSSSDEGLDAEVERMLRTFEGPETPRPRPEQRRVRRPVAAVLAGVVVLAGVGVAAALLVGGGQRKAALGESPACRTLELAGRGYQARPVPAGMVGVGGTAGRGTLRCGRTAVRVSVARIEGVDPRTAVVRPDDPGRVYVTARVCPSRRAGALLACLRNAPVTP